MRLLTILLIGIVVFASGCTSPEAERTRGSGPGADIGNRGKVIDMHEGSRQFLKTPNLVPTKHPPLDSASQADQLSRR